MCPAEHDEMERLFEAVDMVLCDAVQSAALDLLGESTDLTTTMFRHLSGAPQLSGHAFPGDAAWQFMVEEYLRW
jgi:hypothetical protein